MNCANVHVPQLPHVRTLGAPTLRQDRSQVDLSFARAANSTGMTNFRAALLREFDRLEYGVEGPLVDDLATLPKDPSWRRGSLNLLQRLFPHAPPLIQIELTAQLVSNGKSIGMMGVVAAGIGIQAALNHDIVHASLLLSIAIVSVLRVTWLRRLRERHGTHPSDLPTARRWEHGYARAVSPAASCLEQTICSLCPTAIRR